MIAFATAALRGVLSGHGFEGTIKTALVLVAVFFVVGWLIGHLAGVIVEESARDEIRRLFAEYTGNTKDLSP